MYYIARDDINIIRQILEHKYTKYKMLMMVVMVMCNKQHLSNIWSWIHLKVNTTVAELKKRVAYKKACNLKNTDQRLTLLTGSHHYSLWNL